MGGGESDGGSEGNASGDRLPRRRLMWEDEEASTKRDDLALARAFSLGDGRMIAGAALVSPMRSCATSDEVEGR